MQQTETKLTEDAKHILVFLSNTRIKWADKNKYIKLKELERLFVMPKKGESPARIMTAEEFKLAFIELKDKELVEIVMKEVYLTTMGYIEAHTIRGLYD